jgi:hypothetical protein
MILRCLGLVFLRDGSNKKRIYNLHFISGIIYSTTYIYSLIIYLIKNLLPLLALLLATACSNAPHIEYNVKPNTFITAPGRYEFKGMWIIVHGLEDGTLLYGIANEKRDVLYQHPISKPFSKYQYWALFVDDAQNVWFYNSDYGEFMAHSPQAGGGYATTNGYTRLETMPKELKTELEKQNTFKNKAQVPPATGK